MDDARASERRAWLAAAFVIALAYHPLPIETATLVWRYVPAAWKSELVWYNWLAAVELLFALALALSTSCASGFTLGRAPMYWRPLLCGTVLFLATLAVVYPRLDRDRRPFAGDGSGYWMLSAVAQELVFTGFFYGRFCRLYPERIWWRIDMPWAVVVIASLFSLSHVWNFAGLSPQYVWFQLAYTFLGGIGHALLRHWTGSVLYPILVHVAVNWIAAQP